MSRKPRFHFGLAMLFVMFIITACSGGSNPVTGSFSGGDEGLSSNHNISGAGQRALWGVWTCVIDAATGTIQAIPKRGVMFHVNAVTWMQPPGGSLANLGVQIVNDQWVAKARFDIKVTLTHPFAGMHQFTGFDVMGVFMTDGHSTLLSQPGVTFTNGATKDPATIDPTTINNACLLNPDGYTRWFNQDEFNDPSKKIFSYIPGKAGINAFGLDATLNPYKYFTRGIGQDDNEFNYLAANSADRGHFPAGASIARLYQIQWPKSGGVGQMAFDYAVIASWAPAANSAPAVPDDFPITANALEPVALSINDDSDLYYDTVNDVYGGDVVLDLELFGWQGLIPGQKIPGTINRVIVEFLNSPQFPGGSYKAIPSSSFNITGGTATTSTWHCEIGGFAPATTGYAPAWIIFETKYNYDNGVGSDYPAGAPLTAYFPTTIRVYGAPGLPVCDTPTTGWTHRTWIELENFHVDVATPGGTTYDVDWSIEPSGNPKNWIHPATQPANDFKVNWYAATDQGLTLGNYDVCVSAYNGDLWSECCLSVTVSGLKTLQAVVGQQGITLNKQPDQGTGNPCDIAVYNTGSASTGQILDQDFLGKVRLFRYTDDYTVDLGYTDLSTSGLPAPNNNPQAWNPYHKFDVTTNGNTVLLSSSSDVWPSFTQPTLYINDPYHAFILPFFNQSGSLIGQVGFYGDSGAGSDPDAPNRPWRHFADWSGGAVNYNNRMYGLMAVSEIWKTQYPSYTHPGTVWCVYAGSPYQFPANFTAFALAAFSTQHTSGIPGPFNDTNPDLMAVAVDDNVPHSYNFYTSPALWNSQIDVWYMLSAEPTANNRKVHIVWLPRNYSGIDMAQYHFRYDGYIGPGGTWGNFTNGYPVDIEVINANKTNGLDQTYNWLAVLLKTPSGWAVEVFRYDPAFASVVRIAAYTATGVDLDPTALDVDQVQDEIHVLYNSSLGYKVTVLKFVP